MKFDEKVLSVFLHLINKLSFIIPFICLKIIIDMHFRVFPSTMEKNCAKYFSSTSPAFDDVLYRDDVAKIFSIYNNI